VIEEGRGNLLTADVEALVNTVNTVGVMGKGIALQFKRAFPANYAAYRAACERGEVRLGRMFVYETDQLGSRRHIINFPTKQHWRSHSSLADIRAGLDDLVRVVHDLRVTSIAIPALGCGNGGLDWADVRPLIEAAAARIPETRVAVFAPAGAPDPASMPVAAPRPAMTAAKATLLVAIHRYLARAAVLEVREGISELEIQKLAYFLQALGAPLRLRFSRGRYGPYAEQLHHVLQAMEGHYVVGYGDRSAKVTELQPIRLTAGSAAEAEGWVHGDAEAASRLAGLLRLVDGFETPYSLELLATVHFASQQEPVTMDTTELADRVVGWSLRKARLFTAEHVQVAAERLREHGALLPAG
jgi:O-acetyl-ADP-ribose deacetylase (regulator of RNase III)